MFERFTERARQAIVLAQEEARRLSHDHIGTEHILLGLVREREGLAAAALDAVGVTAELVRVHVVRLVGMGEAGAAEQVPFTPRAKKTLELALREALRLGHNYIGTEHLLLTVLGERDGVAARVLRDVGVDLDRLREEIMRLAGRPEHVERRRAEAAAALQSTFRAYPAPARLPTPASFAQQLGEALAAAGHEAARAGRPVDLGDLLVALAADRETVAGFAAAELHVDPRRARASAGEARELDRRIGELHRQAEALAADDPARAEELRKSERELVDRRLHRAG